MPKYTVFVQEADGRGTIHISNHEAESVEAAKAAGIAETIEDWGDTYTAEDVHCLGVAAGDVEILDWEDIES